MTTTLRSTLLAASVLFAPLQIHGQVVAARTFGPGDSFDGSISYFVAASESFASPFDYTGPAGFFLTQVRLALRDAVQPYTIMFSQGPSMNGATSLESWTVGPLTAKGIVTLASVFHPQLVTGEHYWVSAANTGFGGWFKNDQGLSGPELFELTATGTWFNTNNILPAFDVTIDNKIVASPEPSTTLLIGSGLFGLAISRLRRRR